MVFTGGGGVENILLKYIQLQHRLHEAARAAVHRVAEDRGDDRDDRGDRGNDKRL